MIPVNGKPVIGWILDDLLAKNIHQPIVVVRQEDRRLQAFLERFYQSRLAVRIVPVNGEGTILTSIRAGLQHKPPRGLVRVILGDTLITDSFESEGDFVYTAQVQEPGRWCLAALQPDGRIATYLDKTFAATPPYIALAGYYHLADGAAWAKAVDDAIEHQEREISHALHRYQGAHPLFARPAACWYDFGHIDKLVEARQKLLQPRSFNSVAIDPVLGTIAKVSINSDKLQDELDWYRNLPEELKVLTPRLLSNAIDDGRVRIVQEYYGYPTLAELYVYGDLHWEVWLSILRRVITIHRTFRRFPGQLSEQHVADMYARKTFERLEWLAQQDERWQTLLSQSSIRFNGRTLRGIPALRDDIATRSSRLAAGAPITIIHGDYCFSNILFDVAHQIIRLIDPRGRFGVKGIYGDPRYDMAKLCHSVRDHYDYIVADMFELREAADGYQAELFLNPQLQAILQPFLDLIRECGYDLAEIDFIEGLLFLSMLPLHHGHPRRQLLMFLTGLRLLNEAL